MLTNTCIPMIMEICMCSSVLGLMMNNKHLLMSLLFLESLMLTLVILIPAASVSSSSQSMFMSIILLSFGACEASLGLALMVMMSRSYGSDLMNSISTNKC